MLPYKIHKIFLFIAIAISTIRCEGASFRDGQDTLFMAQSLVPYSKQIPLTQGKFTTVSYWWYDFLIQWKWQATKTGYAKRHINNIKMHRVILGVCIPSIVVDHKDRDGLNNCEHNLRIASFSQNCANVSKRTNTTSKYLGVTRLICRKINKIYWVSRIHKNKKYHNYGGRGITMCPEWANDYAQFLKDMGRKITPKHTINRIDNNGNYEPSNCKWSTWKEQQNNKESNRIITFNNSTKSIHEWSDFTGIKYGTILMRLHRNWSIEKTLTYGCK